MATIEFKTNLKSNTSKPWKFDSKKDFNNVPSGPGVYIVGVKINVNGQGEKFCPLYVGIRNNLQKRMKEHQGNIVSNGYLNTVKDLFDISQPIQAVYSDIEVFNKFKKKKTPNHQNNLIAFAAVKSKPNNNTLIWFPNFEFFNRYLSTSFSKYPLDKNGKLINVGHNESLKLGGDLDKIYNADRFCGAHNLKRKIEDVKRLIEQNFYFVYVTLESIVEDVLKDPNSDLFNLAKEYILHKFMDMEIVRGQEEKFAKELNLGQKRH